MSRLYKRLVFILLSFSLVCAAQVPVIFDTDMGNDIDDALALGILHALTSRGECRLIGVTLTNASPAAIPYIHLVNSFYGRPDIPVGSALKTIKGGTEDHYLGATLKSAPVSFGAAAHDSHSEPAVALLRRLLQSSTEKVALVQVGFSTNLAALLESKPDSISPLSGSDLVRQKVASLTAMAGNFTGGEPEYNVKLDVEAARTVFEHWPSPIVLSGFEIGRDLLYPAARIERDFSYADWHPVATSYRAFEKMPYDRPTWDLTAVLQAVRGEHGYFELSVPGKIHVGSDGATQFEAGTGDRRYLKVDSAKRAQILEALTILASEPPTGRSLNNGRH